MSGYSNEPELGKHLYAVMAAWASEDSDSIVCSSQTIAVLRTASFQVECVGSISYTGKDTPWMIDKQMPDASKWAV